MNRLLLSIALLALSPTALAEQPISGNYFGLTYLEMQQTDSGASYAPSGFMLRYGMPVNADWSFEIQTGAGNAVGTTSVHRINSLFLRYGSNYEQMYVYSMFGLSRVTASVGGVEYTDDRGSYGIGLMLKAGNTHVTMEWVNYAVTSTYSLNSINFGIIKPL